jgi:hypothetical protein
METFNPKNEIDNQPWVYCWRVVPVMVAGTSALPTRDGAPVARSFHTRWWHCWRSRCSWAPAPRSPLYRRPVNEWAKDQLKPQIGTFAEECWVHQNWDCTRLETSASKELNISPTNTVFMNQKLAMKKFHEPKLAFFQTVEMAGIWWRLRRIDLKMF